MLPSLHRYYDWFLNEQCNEDNSCGVYKQVGTQKPVLGAEYCDATSQDNGRTQARLIILPSRSLHPSRADLKLIVLQTKAFAQHDRLSCRCP